MKKSTVKLIGTGIGVLLAVVVAYALSWIVTCGLIKLITMCFGLTFSWTIATGIWLIWLMLKSLFSNTVTVKKQEVKVNGSK